MKTFLQILLFCLLIFFENSVSYGCLCPGVSLKNSFKGAKAVFIGTLPENSFSTKAEIKGAKNGTVFEVEKSWKGVDGKYFSVTNKFENMGMCSILLQKLEKGKRYLIFAEGENYEIRNYCTYTEEIYSTGDKATWYFERQQKRLKELNKIGNFWFRLSKRIGLI